MTKVSDIEDGLRDVRALIARGLERTVLRQLTSDPAAMVASGKMLSLGP